MPTDADPITYDNIARAIGAFERKLMTRSLKTLPETVKVMAKHQLGKDLDDTQVAEMLTFLGALEGEIPQDYIKKPALPE